MVMSILLIWFINSSCIGQVNCVQWRRKVPKIVCVCVCVWGGGGGEHTDT